ncbi:MAG: hypothetical protein P9L99_14945 [Candidatus Lernaella stagnicola]|nr:hypothetical protein [Candidatus Lernaella stagnicola]
MAHPCCAKCGAAIHSEDTGVCPHCGAPLDADHSEPPEPVTHPCVHVAWILALAYPLLLLGTVKLIIVFDAALGPEAKESADKLIGCIFFGLPIIILAIGITTLRKIKRDSTRFKGLTPATIGVVVSGCICALIAYLLVASLFFSPKKRAYNASAQSSGRCAKLAEEVYFQRQGGEDHDACYSCELEELLTVDKHLADDPGVTFVFSVCTQSGYTFTTTHAKDERQNRHTFTD